MSKKNALHRTGTSEQGARRISIWHRITFRAGAQVLAAAMILSPLTASADIDDEPQIIVIELADQSKHIYAPNKTIVATHEYDWDDETIDAVASIYWAETGRGDRAYKEKLAITQLIWNRTQYGDPFPGTILEVCEQRNEFNHGHISDRNRELARLNLNKVRSQAEGYYQGIEMWDSCIYMTREGGTGILTFQDDQWVTCYRVED